MARAAGGGEPDAAGGCAGGRGGDRQVPGVHAGAVGGLARRARAPPAARPGAPPCPEPVLAPQRTRPFAGATCCCQVCSSWRGGRSRPRLEPGTVSRLFDSLRLSNLVAALQAASELRKLATRTAGAVGAAAQSAVTRQQMGELLHFASGARARASSVVRPWC